MQHAPAWMRTTLHTQPDLQAVRLHDNCGSIKCSCRLLLMSPDDCLLACMQLPAVLPV